MAARGQILRAIAIGVREGRLGMIKGREAQLRRFFHRLDSENSCQWTQEIARATGATILRNRMAGQYALPLIRLCTYCQAIAAPAASAQAHERVLKCGVTQGRGSISSSQRINWLRLRIQEPVCRP